MAKLETPLTFLALQLCFAAAVHATFHSMYAFGDSLTDTGNALIYRSAISNSSTPFLLPYGETYFHRPSGRASDGRIVVDFLAKRVGAHAFLLPYLALEGGKSNGKLQSLVNFAVAGATAENVDFLNTTFNLPTASVPFSTHKQLQWFSSLPVFQDKEALSRALFYFGEIGGNDYNLALMNNFSIDKIIIELVPNVIKVINNALEFLIESGAKYLVVGGGPPIGCTPAYRTFYTNVTKFDKYGCVQGFQKLFDIHNKLLKQVVHNLTIKYDQDVHITFFDQLKAYLEILKRPLHYGFTNTMDPCYNVFQSANITNKKPCPTPSTYISWDGLHFTEAANHVLLNLFYTKGFVTPYPNFLTSKAF